MPQAAARGAHRRPGAPILHFPFLPSGAWARRLPQRCPVPLVNYRGRAAAPGTLLHTPGNPPPPRGQPELRSIFTPPQEDNLHRGPPPHSALSEPSPDKPLRIHYKAPKLGRPAPNKEQRRGRALATEPPLPTKPVRARTRGPPESRQFRFQKRSSFKVISARPVGRRDPLAWPLSSGRLLRVTNKPGSPCSSLSSAASALTSPGPWEGSVLPDGHHVCPRRFPPPPARAQRVGYLVA